MEKLRHFIKAQQLTLEHINYLCHRADELRNSIPENPLLGKILATLFYEPSTRTRFSFETAMLKLGGKCISTENASDFSSAVKGESLLDTIRIMEKYSDLIVLRHKEEGAAELAAQISKVPIINAGDGKGQHPTQALLDIYTIRRELGKSDNLRVGIVGDLKHGRTARSLAYLLSKQIQKEIVFISPPELAIGNDIKAHLAEHQTPFRETSELEPELPFLDVIYMTRIQKERMSPDEYEKSKNCFRLGEAQLKKINPNSRIMHPLPKIDEIQLPIATEESDPRVAYFRQAENGLFIRMALLEYLLKKSI